MERYRPQVAEASEGRNNYFPRRTKHAFIHSGSGLLDGVLGGGWVLGRVGNIVGDKSTGKTLLAIEACANFARQYPKGKIFYRESEAAFDEDYAVRLGLPAARVDFGPEGLDTIWDTIEDVFVDIEQQLTKLEKSGAPALYVIDSLDALSSRAELARKVGEASYALEKPKVLGELLRRLARRVKATKMCVLVISQVRDKIGFVVGEKHKRSGGHALDFYASHALWLTHLKTVARKVGGIKVVTAIRVQAYCKKNKIGSPFRKAQFTIRFGYGIEDVESALEWLAEVKRLDLLGLKANGIDAYLDAMDKMSVQQQIALRQQVRLAIMEAWERVEADTLPKQGKYA